MAKEKDDLTMTEYLVAQLEQPVLTTQVDANGNKIRANATDPRDGHELTAKEAIAMKLMQNALNGDINAAKFIMEQERIARQFEMLKKKK
jgi:hypothetical protein